MMRLTFERVSSFVFDSAGVVIDAPRLCFLSINDNISKSIIIHNMESAVLQMSLVGFVRLLEIDDEFFDDIYEEGVSLRRSNIHKFLHGISMAKSMKISRGTFKLMCHYSKLEPLPQFGNMSYLDITLCLHDFKWLPAFLESFPNLTYPRLGDDCELLERIRTVSRQIGELHQQEFELHAQMMAIEIQRAFELSMRTLLL
ncbi:hypothetical protein Bca52824_051860 [Brassica carinata]|uniref:Uncharacterized protein n=1 Tax=Brassica carinata TaxID=52824 RepID=A0A8X7R223_BRACI|nr:hypothetical protein Bca52824_051860 [Brassica carinata]